MKSLSPQPYRSRNVRKTGCGFLAASLILIFTARGDALSWGSSGPQSDTDCYRCHGRPGLTKKLPSGREISLFVDRAAVQKSVHKGLSCVDCHRDAGTVPHPDSLQRVDCGSCHEEASAYLQSIHGQAHSRGDPQAPSCVTCHGKHDVLAAGDPRSMVSRSRISELCLSCHTDEEIVRRHDLPQPEQIRVYEYSVHGKAVVGDSTRIAAVCTDCHGTHDIEPPDDPRSETYKPHIPKVCGKCHEEIAAQYATSVHGQAIAAGILDAPVCTDCHGEHTITPPTDPASKVAPKNIPKTCSACHEDVALAEKYGFPARRYTTYLNSYHGVANKYGRTTVANCASCHGVHDILPASDPRSRIYPANLPTTCGGCHPGAGKNILVGGKVHVKATRETSPGTYYVRRFYTWFISILMAGFILYMVIETYGHLRRRRAESRNENSPD